MQPTPTDVAISLQHVSKRFARTDAEAVTDLSLDVPTGSLVALVGPSGCGKTTTLKMINRLVEPTSGTIEVLGVDQRSVATHELRRNIGYVIQHVGLFPHRTIERNIGVVPELLGWDKRRTADRAVELAALVGLDRELLDRYPPELSGGQQQRVGVARALAADPPVLLMDEPFSAVDPIVRERLQDDLLALQHELRKTIVFVTHDIDEAVKLGDRVAILNVGGVLEQYDVPERLLARPASEFVASFLGRERGLRRLSLMTVGDVALADGPIVRRRDPAATVATTAAAHATSWAAVVDDERRLVGWVAADHSAAAVADAKSTVDDLELQPFVARVEVSTPLREALDVVVTSRSRLAAVVQEDRLLGFITIDEVAGGLDA